MPLLLFALMARSVGSWNACGLMKIGDYRAAQTERGVEFSAKVVWEDSDFPAARLRVASPGFEDETVPGEFFLLSMLPPALEQGEGRLRIEGTLDLDLAENLPIALGNLSKWFCDGRRVPALEAEDGFVAVAPAGEACGLTLSGGMDSLAMVLENRRHFDEQHPLYFRHAFFVDGMDINHPYFEEDQAGFFQEACESLQAFCDDKGIELVPVHTNMREPSLARCGWDRMHHGMALAAVLVSHPLVLPHCGGYAVKIHYGLPHLGRLERARIVGEDPAALEVLRVCWERIRNDGPLNCSRCHKCVMTMLELLVWGKLAECSTFDLDDVTSSLAEEALRDLSPSSLPFYRELAKPLREMGRGDLAEVVAGKAGRTEYGTMNDE